MGSREVEARGKRIETVRAPQGCAWVELTKHQFALIDLSDVEWVSLHSWTAQQNGSGNWYAVRGGLDGNTIWMHREVAGNPDGLVVDHANRNSLDNRQSNLRSATVSQNTTNGVKKPGRGSKYRGVHPTPKASTFSARIRVDGEYRHLGCFQTEVEAARAYDAAAREHHGEFATLNLPAAPVAAAGPKFLCGEFMNRAADAAEEVAAVGPGECPTCGICGNRSPVECFDCQQPWCEKCGGHFTGDVDCKPGECGEPGQPLGRCEGCGIPAAWQVNGHPQCPAYPDCQPKGDGAAKTCPAGCDEGWHEMCDAGADPPAHDRYRCEHDRCPWRGKGR